MQLHFNETEYWNIILMQQFIFTHYQQLFTYF